MSNRIKIHEHGIFLVCAHYAAKIANEIISAYILIVLHRAIEQFFESTHVVFPCVY